MKNDDLIRRLCEASEGSAELSAEVWVALAEAKMTDEDRRNPNFMRRLREGIDLLMAPCLTTSLSAAWEEAKARKPEAFELGWCKDDCTFYWQWGSRNELVVMEGKHEACTILAALLAAEGER